MDYENIFDALDVSAWDLSESEFTGALNAQARLMAGLHLEPSIDLPPCSPYLPLRF